MILVLILHFINSQLITNKYVVINSKMYPEKMLDIDRNKLRLKSPKKSTFKDEDTNIAMIIDVNGKYNILFYKSSVYQKSSDPGVIGKSPVNGSESGFFFDIIGESGAYRFKNRGLCLSVRGYDNQSDGNYVNGQSCLEGATEQLFYIREAPIESLEHPEKYDSAQESEDQLVHIPDTNPAQHKNVYNVFYHTPEERAKKDPPAVRITIQA